MEKKSKPALILVHGLRGSHHGLTEIAKELRKDFSVFAPDLPGSNNTDDLDNKTLDKYTEWFHEHVSSLPDKPVMVGHSMGSIIVSHYVNKYPNDVDGRVVLLSPVFREGKGEVLGKVMYKGVKVVLAPMSPKRRHELLSSKKLSWVISHYLTYDKTKQDIIDDYHYKYSGKFVSAEALIKDIEISMLHETKIPEGKENLVIFGQNDRLTSRELTLRRVEKVGVKHLEIENAGHLINYEAPVKIAREIRDFLLD